MYLQELKTSIRALVVLTLLTGVLYPLTVTSLSQILFPWAANGSLIMRQDKVVGSRLIGQAFDAPRYFWSRPSATGPAAYNASGSSGSNLGPTNPALTQKVQDRLDALHKANPDPQGPVPVDLVTASASGLDPHVTPAAALYQVSRVANARGVSEDALKDLIRQHTQGRFLGLLGEPRVNVLELNLALDERKP